MFKRICSAFLCLVTILTVFSCASNNDDNGVSTTPGSSSEEAIFDYVPSEAFKYDKELAPVWLGDTSYKETVMFVGKDDQAPLLYNADCIVSVTSFDEQTEYKYGVDYVYENGKLRLLPNTKIPYMPLDEYYGGDYDLITKYNGVDTPTFWGGGIAMARYQVKVTYTHSDTSNITVPDNSAKFEKLIKKLEKGEDVTVFFLGDSITHGWDSSQRGNFAPYTPAWPALFTQYLAYIYGYKVSYVATRLSGTINYPKASDTFGDRGTIKYINVSVGGWKINDAYVNREEYVKDLTDEHGCDLLFLAFGMNNGGTGAIDFADQVQVTAQAISKYVPDASFVLVAPMLPNNENVNGTGNVGKFEARLKPIVTILEGEGITAAVAPVTSVSKYLCSVKRYRDHSGNNMNHPGDYTHRIYAQVALQTVLGYAEEYTEALPEISTPENTTDPDLTTTTKPVTTTPNTTTKPVTTKPVTTPATTTKPITPEEPDMPDTGYSPTEPYYYAEELVPIWEGNTVYKEYVMFLGKNDEVPLLYPATKILSVTSADGETTYKEGIDYVLQNGKLVMPKGSGMLYIPENVYWNNDPFKYGITTSKDGVPTLTYSGPGNSMMKYQVAVTYEHSSTSNITVPDCSSTFASVIEKLEKGKDVTFIFYGDSITNGWESSLRTGHAPYNHPYAPLVTEYFAYLYGYKINYVNTGLASTYTYPNAHKISYGNRGTINYINVGISGLGAGQKYVDSTLGSTDCVKLLDTYVLDMAEQYGLDVLFFAFGMNDGWYGPTTVSSQASVALNKVFEKYPSASAVVVSSMIPNNENISTNPNNVPDQEAELIKTVNALAGEGKKVALAPMQSVHKAICAIKRYRDHSGNNMNHPGDYTHRVYAQVILQTMLGYADK